MSEIDRILTNLKDSERILPGAEYAVHGETKIGGLDAYLFDVWWGYQFVVNVKFEKWDVEDDHVEILMFNRPYANSEPSIIASLKPNLLGMVGVSYSFEFSKEVNKSNFMICCLSCKGGRYYLAVDDFAEFASKSSAGFYKKYKWDFKFP